MRDEHGTRRTAEPVSNFLIGVELSYLLDEGMLLAFLIKRALVMTSYTRTSKFR